MRLMNSRAGLYGLRLCLVTALLLAALEPAFSQVAPASDPRLERLPARLREEGLRILNEKDETERARLASELGRTSPKDGMAFLLALLDGDLSSRVRAAIINRLGAYSDPQVRQSLASHAASDADAGVAILALERLRYQQARDQRELLLKRIEMARAGNDEAALEKLGQEQERWISIVRGTMLPAFLRVPPEKFSLKRADLPARVLAFGDFGNGTEHQKRAALAMLEYHKKSPFDFALTLGDNFYGEGMASTTDPRWKTWWSDLYDRLGIKFYATLGNHDWVMADSPAAEILFSERSPSWRMPSPYYTFTAGPIQFFALDTNEVSEAQLLWLKGELARSRARWKLVYGHHPVYSAGAHADNPALIARLLPVLKGRADVYLAGHDHDLQHLKPEGGLHFFVAGGGGAGIRPVKADPRSLFARSAYGFAVVEATERQLKIKFIGADLSPLYEYTLKK